MRGSGVRDDAVSGRKLSGTIEPTQGCWRGQRQRTGWGPTQTLSAGTLRTEQGHAGGAWEKQGRPASARHRGPRQADGALDPGSAHRSCETSWGHLLVGPQEGRSWCFNNRNISSRCCGGRKSKVKVSAGRFLLEARWGGRGCSCFSPKPGVCRQSLPSHKPPCVPLWMGHGRHLAQHPTQGTFNM